MPVPFNSGYTTTLSVGDIATRVKRQFGDESSVQINDADIIRWVNDAQREIAISNDLLQTTGRSTLLAGENIYGLPQGLLVLRSIHCKGRKLKALSPQEAEEYADTTETVTGNPSHFWVYASEITIYPTPDTTVTDGLKIYYTRQPILLTELGDIPEISAQYHTRIVDYCLQQAYELDENWEAANQKMNHFTTGLAAVKGREEWQSTDFYPSIVSLPDDYGYSESAGVYW